MSSYNILEISRQKGVKFDVEAVARDLKDAEEELFVQHGDPAYHNEHIFNLIRGKLKLYDGGYESSWSMGNSVNIWGYDGKGFLKIFAKHMASGEIMFTENTEGWGVKVWVVTPNKVSKG